MDHKVEERQLGLPLERSVRDQYDDGTYPEGFWDWLEQNWHVYQQVVRMARHAQRRGVKRWSVFGIIQILRWRTALRQQDGGASALKINDHSGPGLARLAMAREPDLRGFFETRQHARRMARRLDGSPYAQGAAA